MQPHWGGILTQIFAAKYFCFSYEMMIQNKRSQSYHGDHLSGKMEMSGNLAAVREMLGNSPKVI